MGSEAWCGVFLPSSPSHRVAPRDGDEATLVSKAEDPSQLAGPGGTLRVSQKRQPPSSPNLWNGASPTSPSAHSAPGAARGRKKNVWSDCLLSAVCVSDTPPVTISYRLSQGMLGLSWHYHLRNERFQIVVGFHGELHSWLG